VVPSGDLKKGLPIRNVLWHCRFWLTVLPLLSVPPFEKGPKYRAGQRLCWKTHIQDDDHR
jgi:hypothetical protein